MKAAALMPVALVGSIVPSALISGCAIGRDSIC
jgi:hypothetical protein